MAKKSVIARDLKRDKMNKKYAEKREALKRAGDYDALQALPKNASPVRKSRRCFLSGRKKGFLRDFGLSRIAFRELANEGKIPGIKKSSW